MGSGELVEVKGACFLGGDGVSWHFMELKA